MNPDWKTFLETTGTLTENGKVPSFTNLEQERQTAASDTVIADLSHLGLIAAEGSDAEFFLQGQLSNDVRQVSGHHSQLNAYCNPKGRALAVLRLFKRDGIYYLTLPRELLDTTLKRLRLFVLRAKVTLSDASDAWVQIGLSGPQSTIELNNALGEYPQAIDAVIQAIYAGGSLTVIQIPGARSRFQIFGDVNTVKTLWQTLSARIPSVGAAPWTLLDIRAGIPTVTTATVDAFVPQMINLHALGGISFTKGCYPGQEIVARMHYLGTLKRRMYYARVISPAPPRPGDELYASESEQSIGQVVDAQPSPEGDFELLAVLQIASADKARLHSQQGPLLTFDELPYLL